MKLYIAHNFNARIELREIINFYLMNHTITASWITDDSHIHTKNRIESANQDYIDLMEAEAVIIFLDKHHLANSLGRGKFVEWGIAIGAHKKIYLVGEDEGCIFTHLSLINQYRFKNIHELMKVIG